MRYNKKNVIIFIIILLILNLLAFKYTSADITQTTYDTETTTLGLQGNFVYQNLGNGISGTLTQADFLVNDVSTPATNYLAVSLWRFPTEEDMLAQTNLIGSDTLTANYTGAGSGTKTATWTGSIVMDETLWYVIKEGGNYGGGASLKWKGSTADVYGGGDCGDYVAGVGCNGVTDLYFILTGVNGLNFTDDVTYLTWFSSPDWSDETSQATSTTNPTFTFNYFVPFSLADEPSEVCLYVETYATSTGQDILFEECEEVTLFGSERTFTRTLDLEDNTLYNYYGTVGYSNQFNFKQTLTNWLQIGVVTGSGIVPILWIQDPVDDDNATSTSSKGFGSVLGLYGVITNKFPFNWAFALGQEIIDLVQMATSTPDFEPAVLNMEEIPLSTWELFPTATSTQSFAYTLFSTTTLHEVAEMEWVNLMRTLVSAMLWISFAGVVINKTFGIFNKFNS